MSDATKYFIFYFSIFPFKANRNLLHNLKQAQLLISLIFRKRMQVLKHPIYIVYNTMFLASRPKQLHQFSAVITGKLVSISILLLISLLQSRKVPIQCPIIIFSVTLPKSKPHSKAYDTIYLCLHTIVQNPFYFFTCIINKWNDGRQPYSSINSKHFRVSPGSFSQCIYGSHMAPVPIMHFFRIHEMHMYFSSFLNQNFL